MWVKFLTHSSRGCNGAVQRRLATLTVTMLISSCWQLSSEVELRRIFDVCKRWANSGSHEFVKKNMVRYMRPQGRFAHCSCKNVAWTRGRGRRQAEVEGECCIFTLAVRQPPVLASCIEIYYFPLFHDEKLYISHTRCVQKVTGTFVFWKKYLFIRLH